MKKLFLPLMVLAALSFAQPASPATSPADASAQPAAESAPVTDAAPVEAAGPAVATSPAESATETVPAPETSAGMAQDTQAEACMGGGGFMSFLPMIAIIVIFYFLMIRPQQKQAKKLRQMRDAFQVSDRVVTSGGIHGVITNIKGDIITIRIADNVKIDVDKVALTGEGTPAGESCSTCR